MKQQMMIIKRMLLAFGAGNLAFGAGLVNAQGVPVFKSLPPLPPNIPSLEQAPKDAIVDEVQPLPTLQPLPIREFNFEAPRTTTAKPSFTPRATTITPSFTPTATSNASNQYRVEIRNTDPQILAAIKEVEPNAFLKGDRIQAGSFARPENAQTLKTNLQARGIMANVVEISLSSANLTTDGNGYFVAIPTNRRNFSDVENQLRLAGIGSSLIQERGEPRGSHIAIGPFANRQDAELMNNRVRASNLDSRVYFQN